MRKFGRIEYVGFDMMRNIEYICAAEEGGGLKQGKICDLNPIKVQKKEQDIA